MEEQNAIGAPAPLTSAQQALAELWDQHLRSEFVAHNAQEAVDTMVEDATVNHVPVMTGGVGRQQVEEFYSTTFLPQIPPDLQLTPISRTIDTDQLVDEFVATFTHTIQMDWLLPGVPPTNKQVVLPVVAIIRFREREMASETLYWDQATVLVQLGLLTAEALPVSGVESARKVLDPTLPSNALIERAKAKKPQVIKGEYMLHFDERSNGSVIQLTIGDTFEIVLHENPTTGFRWHLVSSGEPACKLLADSFETGGGSPGSGGNHTWQFHAMQEGLGKIELVYQRSWERNKPPAQRFTLNAHIQT